MTSDNGPTPLDVAVVGGGVIGIMTTLGLLKRGMKVTIYERASSWHEIGAAFSFAKVARDCMERLDPSILDVLSSISTKSSSGAAIRYWNGFHPRTKAEAEREDLSLLFKIPESQLNFWGCVRSQFLFGMTRLLPEGTAKFGKQLIDYEDEPEGEKIVLRFADGSVASADVLVGCDGIHSTTRKMLLGVDNPASRPSYTNTAAYRAMVPIAGAIAALGEDKAMGGCMHCGPGANMMSYPVLNGTLFNLVIWTHEVSEFPDTQRMLVPATRDEVERAFVGWSPALQEVVKLLPEKFVKWGIFDMAQHPAPTYARGRVCIAGDAAHASSPYQGLGACMGVEDALAVCEVLDVVNTSTGESGAGKQLAVERALRAFSDTRMERSQWLVRSSREMGEMYQWRYGPTGRDAQRCHAKLEEASRKVSEFSVEGMVHEARIRAKATKSS